MTMGRIMHIPKIEDLLHKASESVEFKIAPAQSLTESDETDSPSLSFSKLLDFSFPKSVSEASVVQVGEVTYVGDGVVHVAGLPSATIEEIILIQTKHEMQRAMILGVQEGKVEAVVMGDYTQIKRGDAVKSTGNTLQVPVGPELRGRVINSLGIAVDGKGKIKAKQFRNVESPAPGVMDRQPIFEPLNTGILALDTTIPIGKGQRELVVGDRKTGKSRTMLDIISNQKGQDVYCIYVGVGIQAAKAKATLELLEERGAMTYTTMVIALADEPPTLQYIAPYVGAALGEYYMYQGKHSLVIYDDLSKQAKAYRQVSLLLKRSPGRDAYPGDIFFLHSRLLERASKVAKHLKSGSLTALPIAETQAGDISDYIITNLMSITDGHIYLDSNLMHEGILPAVNSGASVSRIGGKVQTPLLRKVGEQAGRILARYNEVKSFETINTEVAEETLLEIKRGKRVKECFSQNSSLNMTPDEQVCFLAIATSTRMDHLDMPQIAVYKDSFVEFYRKSRSDNLVKLVNTSKDLSDIDSHLDNIFDLFCSQYQLPSMI